VPQPTRQQLSAPLENRIGGSGEVRVDALEVAHDVEKELAHLDAFGPAYARASEMFVGCTQFKLAEDFLFAEQTASGAWSSVMNTAAAARALLISRSTIWRISARLGSEKLTRA
jgi:hypothetical protein